MKKSLKRFALAGLSLSMLLLLTGCISRDKSGNPSGFIWDLIGRPTASLIDYFANHLGLGFGIAIILMTIVVRLIILPLGLYQSRKAAYQSERMAYLKPILDPIQKRMQDPNATQEQKMAAQAEYFAVQRENGVSMFGGIGCLPILIQMPFFSAMFFAAQYTKGIAESSFLWMKELGKPDFILLLVIVGLYFIQSWLSVQAVPEEQRQQMKSTMYIMPIMMAVMSFSLPASVGLYWVVGGFFSIFQQLITTYLIKPRLRKQVAEEFEKNPPKASKTTARKDVTPAQPSAAITTNKTRRNAGKQRRK